MLPADAVSVFYVIQGTLSAAVQARLSSCQLIRYSGNLSLI